IFSFSLDIPKSSKRCSTASTGRKLKLIVSNPRVSPRRLISSTPSVIKWTMITARKYSKLQIDSKYRVS
ncbi:hypothetical protein PFISCL1PPCAC_11621, partial [Pristionchus fissidentatus]